MSELDKFISRVQAIRQSKRKGNGPFDVKFLVKVVNEIPNNQSAKEEVIYTGGSFKDK